MHGGEWAAALNGKGRANSKKLYQRLTIPVDSCSAELRFWLRIDSNEPATARPVDRLKVMIRKVPGAAWQTLAVFSNRDATGAYGLQRIDLSAFRGKTVWIQWTGVENRSQATRFFLDDIELEATR